MKSHVANRLGAIALCVGVFGIIPAHATTLYDNLGAISAGTNPANGFGPLYDSFSTGTSSFSLDSLSLLIDASAPGDQGTFSISILADSGSSIFGIYTSGPFADSTLSTSLAPFSLSFVPLSLPADTLYWVALSSSANGSVNWSWSYDTSGPGVADEFFANTTGVFPNSDGPYQMEVGGLNPTPVPATLPLFASGVGAMGLFGWRRKRKAAAIAA